MAVQNKIQGTQLDLASIDGTQLTGVDADLLQGNNGAYYNAAGNLTGNIADARLPGPYNFNLTGNLTGNADSANDSDALGGVAAASWAKLASPAFSGNPTAPTQTIGNNSTRLATTAFVQSAVGGSSGYNTSAAVSYSGPNQNFFWNHGLGHRPKSLLIEMRCVTADGTWNVGDYVIPSAASLSYSDSGGNCCGNANGVFPWLDSGTVNTRVQIRVGNLGIHIVQQTSGTIFTATPGRWWFYITAA
jgi:hypothetical protein